MKNIVKRIVFPTLVTVICVANPFYEVFASQQKITKYSSNNRIFESSESLQVYLAQSNPIYECWNLTHSSFGIVYESILLMKGSTGVMTTGYFNPNIGRTVYVKQSMRLHNSPRGLVILGYNPVYAHTNLKHPTYNPDNFLLQIRPDGEYLFATCDDAKRCSQVEVKACP